MLGGSTTFLPVDSSSMSHAGRAPSVPGTHTTPSGLIQTSDCRSVVADFGGDVPFAKPRYWCRPTSEPLMTCGRSTPPNIDLAAAYASSVYVGPPRMSMSRTQISFSSMTEYFPGLNPTLRPVL